MWLSGPRVRWRPVRPERNESGRRGGSFRVAVMSQLPLGLALEPHARFETFFAEADSTLPQLLKEIAAGRRRDMAWLYGPSDAGKTHALQAVCHAASGHGLRIIYLRALAEMPIEALQGLTSLDLVAIDDIDRLAGSADMENALFALVDAFYRGGGTLLMASEVLPAHAGFQIPDLVSRLNGCSVYRLNPLSETGRRDALQQLARRRGLALDPTVLDYLLTRVRRDMGAVAKWLDLIDRESLAAQCKVTLPFVRKLLRRQAVAGELEPGGDH